MDDAVFAENVIEYIIAHSKAKTKEEMVSMMQEILGQLKENRFEKLKIELGML